ncbi:MAG: carboxypeptidase-like regulatory domain-containing protein [Candidatus Competibacteraceae bacterium]
MNRLSEGSYPVLQPTNRRRNHQRHPHPPPPRPYAAPDANIRGGLIYPRCGRHRSGWLPPGDRIQVQDYRGVRYTSGGVGESERAELNALSGQFNLRLLFAMQGSGDYLADTKVIIADKRGETVLSATSNGPCCYAQLPPGTYTVEASTPDQTQRQPVTIGARQSRLNFYWR